MSRPVIKKYIPPRHVDEYPTGIIAPAGQLVSGSEGWSTQKPALQWDRCVGCLRCYVLCPDACIVRHEGKIIVDARFCKGCGICAAECPVQAIVLREEGA